MVGDSRSEWVKTRTPQTVYPTRRIDANMSPPTTNEVATEIRKLDWDEPEKYLVEWESGNRWKFESTYAVSEIRFGEGGRPKIKIEGPNGGEYEIDSNPAGKPKVRHLRSDGYVSTDRLAEITVYREEMSWRNQLFRAIPGLSKDGQRAGN